MLFMAESWKPVAEFLIGTYEVSDLGNVRIVQKIGTKTIIQPVDVSSGWLHLFDGRKFGVNVLVATAFVPNPKKYVVVNNKDGDKRNNAAINLEWVCFNSTNIHDKVEDDTDEVEEAICQYSRDGKFIAEYASSKEAGKALSIRSDYINQVISGKRTTIGDSLWRLKSDGPPTVLEPKYRPVKQFSMSNELIKEFSSVAEASAELDITFQRIIAVCEGRFRSTGGFRFQYTGGSDSGDGVSESGGRKKEPHVRQYMPNFLFMYEFLSVKSASKSVGVPEDAIRSCCNRTIKTAGDYLWRWSDDDDVRGLYEKAEREEKKKRNKELREEKKRKKREEVKAAKEAVVSVDDANRFNKRIVSQKKRRPSRVGKSGKIVRQYTLDGKLVREYKSASEAARTVGIASGNISSCCLKKYGYNSCKGFLWRYAEDDELSSGGSLDGK